MCFHGKKLFLVAKLVTTIGKKFIGVSILYMIQWYILDSDIFAMKLRLENLGLAALTQLSFQVRLEITYELKNSENFI